MKVLQFVVMVDLEGVGVWMYVDEPQEGKAIKIGYFPSFAAAVPIIQAQIDVEQLFIPGGNA